MGGFGSGNHSQERRLTTDELPRVHIRDVDADFLLSDLWLPAITAKPKNLYVKGAANRIIFGGKAADKIIEIGHASITYSARNFGGHQAYFQCQCGKKVTTLYIDVPSIACRQCHRLLYNSQFTRQHEQPATKAAKLRAKIGGGPALLQPLPDRPKGMHTETYERISYRILVYEIAAAQELKKYRDEKWLPVLLKLDELAANL